MEVRGSRVILAYFVHQSHHHHHQTRDGSRFRGKLNFHDSSVIQLAFSERTYIHLKQPCIDAIFQPELQQHKSHRWPIQLSTDWIEWTTTWEFSMNQNTHASVQDSSSCIHGYIYVVRSVTSHLSNHTWWMRPLHSRSWLTAAVNDLNLETFS